MFLLNQKNVPPKCGLIGATLLCHQTGKQFLAEQVSFTTNYAEDGIGFVYSDEGVVLNTLQTIQERKPICAYISGSYHGAEVRGWKGESYGKVIYCQEWPKYGRYHSYKMQQFRVRMADGSIWTGRKSSGWEGITLRPIKQ